jgi:two-component system, sensor histidine kinase LadS
MICCISFFMDISKSLKNKPLGIKPKPLHVAMIPQLIRVIFFGLIAFLFSAFSAVGQHVTVELPSQPTSPISLGKYVYYYLDPTESLTLEDILQPQYQNQFLLSDQEKPGFGKGNFSVWIRLHIEREEEVSQPWKLEVSYPNYDTLQMFYPHGEKWQVVTVGDLQPFTQRPFHHRTFVFDLPAELDGSPLYFRISSKGSLIFPATLYTPEQLHQTHAKEELIYGVFYGIMLVMLFYNLFLAISSGSRNYMFYTLIIAGNLLTISSLNGHSFQFLWPNSPQWANEVIVLGIGIWITASNLFARSFLGITREQRTYYYVFGTMVVLGLFLMLMAVIADYGFSILLSNGLLLLNCLTLLTSGVYYWIRGLRIARLYTIAWSVYLIGVILYTVRNLGLLPVNFVTSHVMELGAVLEVVLLSIALGYKYKEMEREQHATKERELAMIQKNKELVELQNQELESRIQERTRELQHKQEEIMAQNEELQQQREELTTKNEKMEEARQIIDKQNKQLKQHSESLEKKVEERTRELIITNKELAESVQKMEQYSYITAHNLRAPVARLLGLITLTELQNLPDLQEETRIILKKIKEEGTELDAIIKDMNTILEIKNKANDSLEVVNLEEKIQNTLQVLKHAIQQTEAVVEYQLDEAPTLQTNPVYIDSIFYNLVSNAIKYRSPERSPLIRIRSHQVGRQLVVEVSDNGIGIDIKQHGKNLFGMYKRFHDHVEGKGLGLYLVKNQVELAGGKIDVKSEPGIGTTFTLTFKKGKNQ